MKRNRKKTTKAIRGIQRQEHFESGGTLQQWRGVHSVHRKRSDKRASRLNRKKKSIMDSMEDS